MLFSLYQVTRVKSNTFQFTSDSGHTYSVYFDRSTKIFHDGRLDKFAYYFGFSCKPQRDVFQADYDPAIGLTIMKIVSDFFESHPHAVLAYICPDLNKQGRNRQVAFTRWYNASDLKTIYTFQRKKMVNVYCGVIYNSFHPELYDIENALDDFDLNDKPVVMEKDAEYKAAQWFSDGLISWYKKNKRDLPWRNESDPYKIWLSEIILQQTQVKQGLSYYLKFVKNYPSVRHLAKAPEDKIMKDWQGLGYYSRARNMHAAAKSMVENYGGKFPQSFDEIKKLKGVGHYTAAAIASFAFNLPHAVVDGNVYRVLSRIFGISEFIDTTQGKKVFQKLADDLLNKKDPALHNQAIMEFGSQYCKPVNPDCASCIFKANCFAFSKKQVAELPLKSKKTKVSERYFNYFVVADKNRNILLNKRSGNDIWKGLYDFSLVETDKLVEPEKLLKLDTSREITGKKFAVLHVSKTYKHVLTHRVLHARFVVIKKDAVHGKNDLNVKAASLTKFAFPRLIEKFMEDCSLNELF